MQEKFLEFLKGGDVIPGCCVLSQQGRHSRHLSGGVELHVVRVLFELCQEGSDHMSTAVSLGERTKFLPDQLGDCTVGLGGLAGVAADGVGASRAASTAAAAVARAESRSRRRESTCACKLVTKFSNSACVAKEGVVMVSCCWLFPVVVTGVATMCCGAVWLPVYLSRSLV